MTDELLTSTDREEALSRAYVHAIAAGAGYTVATMDFDRDGVDVEINSGGLMRPKLDLQLKATINLGDAVGGVFRFPLKRRNYDLLRMPTQTPRLLVVLDLPKNENEWLCVTHENLVMKRCAFWSSLVGLPDKNNTDSVTVLIPSGNRLDIANLRVLMEHSRRGTIK